MIFCSSLPQRTTRRIRGRAVKALRSGRSQLCWRGFESHRMQHLFCFFVGSSLLFIGLDSGGFHTRLCSGRQTPPTDLRWLLNNTLQTHAREEGGQTQKDLSAEPHTLQADKK
jgi:hypothetical protein